MGLGRVISWTILVAMFLLAGDGLNMIRIAIVDKLADPTSSIGMRLFLGLLMLIVGVFFLGGFIYYRLKKRGKIKKPDWFDEN